MAPPHRNAPALPTGDRTHWRCGLAVRIGGADWRCGLAVRIGGWVRAVPPRSHGGVPPDLVGGVRDDHLAVAAEAARLRPTAASPGSAAGAACTPRAHTAS
eukprot:gene8042-23983_t